MSTETGPTIERSTSVACIACDGRKLIRWGQLPIYTSDFLGRDLESNIDPGTLYECEDCTLRFRTPMPTNDELMTYYQGLNVAQCWQHGPEREVWRYIKQALEHVPKPLILDVGCFRGDMLSYLGNGLQRFGVEPSKDAAREAERRGITVLADSIESLGGGLRFGAITLIDVAEHLPRPLDSLRKLANLLLPGGRLIIFTGSTDALSWRLAGLDYYYSAMPEHVAFMRPSWFYWAAAKLSCDVLSIKRLPYKSSSLWTRADEALKNLLYIGHHRLRQRSFVSRVFFQTPLLRRVGQWRGCWWTSAKDHMLVTLARTASK